LRLVLLLALTLTACSKAEGPPYGFATSPEQRFHFEANERTDVDGTEVRIVRMSDVRLRAAGDPSDSSDGTEIELFIERYFIRVEGAPGGDSELRLTEDGLRAVTREGPVQLRAGERTPAGDTVAEMRARPAASVALDAEGEAVGGIWTSPHPLLAGVALLDWILLALPTREPKDRQPWTTKRLLPQVGSYVLGVDVPVTWEEATGPLALRGGGAVARDSLRLAQNFEGKVAVETRGEADLAEDGRVREARLQLRLDFQATNGARVQSSHDIRVTCTSCDAAVNSP
jgi:hypothetical protein